MLINASLDLAFRRFFNVSPLLKHLIHLTRYHFKETIEELVLKIKYKKYNVCLKI